MQIKLCVNRGYQRLQGDMAILITGVIFNAVMALVIGSVFYNLPNDTSSLYSRGALLFFAILLAAFASALEVRSELQKNRPILTLIDLDSICTTPNRGEAIQVCLLPSFYGSNRYVIIHTMFWQAWCKFLGINIPWTGRVNLLNKQAFIDA